MFKLGMVLSELGFTEQQQEDLLYLLRLAGCFDDKQLRQDLKKHKFPDQIIDNAVNLTQTYNKEEWLTRFDKCREDNWIENTKLWLADIIRNKLAPNQPWQKSYQSDLVKLATEMSKHTFTPEEINYDSLFIVCEEKNAAIKRIRYAKKLLDQTKIKLDMVYLVLTNDIKQSETNNINLTLKQLKFNQYQLISSSYFANTIKLRITNANNVRLLQNNNSYVALYKEKPFLVLAGKQICEKEYPTIEEAFSQNQKAVPQMIVPEEDKLTIDEMLTLFREPIEEKILKIIKPKHTAPQERASSKHTTNHSTAISYSMFWNFWRFNQNLFNNHLGTFGLSSLFFLTYSFMPSYNRLPDMSQFSQYGQQLLSSGYGLFANSQLRERGQQMATNGFWAGWELTKKLSEAAYNNLPSMRK